MMPLLDILTLWIHGKIDIGDGASIDIDIHFHDGTMEKFNELVDRYDMKTDVLYNDSVTSRSLFKVAKKQINGIDITAFSPHYDNPKYNREEARKAELRRQLGNILRCGVHTGSVQVIREKLLDRTRGGGCIWPFTNEEIEAELDHVEKKE